MEGPERTESTEPPKKGSLDTLSREELIAKCRSLVGTLLKAKQEKQAMLARTRELEEVAASSEEQKSADKNGLKAMQEIVDALTEQKLQATVRLQELDDQCKRTGSRNGELEIENESLKRQLKRSTDENDDLITEVNNLEGKLLAVNSIGEEQQKHFLQLEESTNKLLDVENKYEMAKQTIDALERDKEQLHSKMKAYKGKIIEIVAKFKKLRASHKATLEVVKEYSNSIPSWQEDLKKVAELMNRNQFSQQNQEPQKEDLSVGNANQEKVAELTASIEDLKRQLETNRKIISQVEAEKLTIIDEKSQFENKFKDLENKLLSRKQENSDLLQEMKELNEIMKDRGETISKQQSELSQSKQSLEELRSDLSRIQSILSERDQTICALIEAGKTKEPADDVASTSTVSKMDESITSAKDISEANEEKYAKLKAMAVKLKKRLEEETKKVKELEASAIVSSDFTATIEKLQKSLKEVEDREKTAKQEADKYKGFAKKYNMLALEMESYEKSMEAQTEKLEQKHRIIKELEQTIEEQQGTIASIKEQVRLVEEKSSSEVNHSQGLNEHIDKLTTSVRELEQLKSDNQSRLSNQEKEILELKQKLEVLTNATESLKKDRDSHQETISLERDRIQSTCSDLEVELRNVSRKLADKIEECERVTKEFSGYKIRAQNILQQNQSQVNSREKELEEELETVKRLMTTAEQNSLASLDRIKELEKAQQTMIDEKERSANRFAEQLVTLEGLKKLNQQLQLENKQHLEEQQSAVKSHRVNVDTLTNVFKSQIEDLEKKLRDQEKLIQDLSNSNRLQGAKLESFAKRSSTDEEKIVEMRMNLERQSHDDSNASIRASHHYPMMQQHQRVARKVSSNNGGLMPLEDLLNSNFDETDYGEESAVSYSAAEEEARLQAKENQIKHLSSLLTEAEQDVAKLNQQNDILKEEIRRQQRSEERDAHINNSEYLKNVIFKFMTTKEEKIHLVPVLTTILKLSPAEVQKLQAVAKGNVAGGESPGRGWTNYLPFK